jgi:hypothetical protein
MAMERHAEAFLSSLVPYLHMKVPKPMWRPSVRKEKLFHS